MSRSKKGAKAPGFDYWGKRGQWDKDITKGSERMATRKKVTKAKKVSPKSKAPTDEELGNLWGHVENEGFGYYMLHWGPDLDLIERMGFDRKKVEAAIKLFSDIESKINEYDEPVDDDSEV